MQIPTFEHFVQRNEYVNHRSKKFNSFRVEKKKKKSLINLAKSRQICHFPSTVTVSAKIIYKYDVLAIFIIRY